MIEKMYYARHMDRTAFEIAALVAGGEYQREGVFSRHMIARDYWLYVLDCPGGFPWKNDWEASEWLKQFEEEV